MPPEEAELRPLIAAESIRPGSALALASVGYATVAAFVVLHLDARGIGHGAVVFGAFAAMVVLTRLIGGDLPDRVGPVPLRGWRGDGRIPRAGDDRRRP